MVILHKREWEQQKEKQKKNENEKEKKINTFRADIKIELEFVCTDIIKWNVGINAIYGIN